MIDFDLMLVHVGEFGLYQKILFLFQAPFCMFVTFTLFGQLFIYLYPRVFWCQENPCLNFNSSTNFTLSREQRQNISIPFIFRDQLFDPCRTYDVTASQIEELISDANRVCGGCSRNSRQICDYSVVNANCTARPMPPSRSKRQYAGNRGGPQYIPGTGSSSYTPRRPVVTQTEPPTDNYNNNYNYYGFSTPPPYTGPTVAGGGGREENWRDNSRTTTKRPTSFYPAGPGSSRATKSAPVCENIKVNRFAIKKQTEGESEIVYNEKGFARNNPNATDTVSRVRVQMPNNVFINTANLSEYRGKKWSTVPCRQWTYQESDRIPYPTIVTELNWYCETEKWITIANAVFYLGAIVGGIGIGYIADVRGRVPALVTANLLGCLGGALSAFFYSNYILFCFFRFIAGMAFDNSFTMIYILVLEYVGPTYRTLVANLSIAVFYTMGTLILPWLALGIGNWRWFMLAISLPMSLAIVGIFVVPESARWLLSKGRTKEATRILRSFAKVNGKNVPEKIFVEFEADANKLYEEISQEKDATLMEAFRKPRIAKNFILLTLIWSMIALVYDGHSRNVLNLGDNVFVSFTIASSTEFPADMLLIFTLDRFGRRWLAFGSLCMSGGFSLAAAMVPAGSTGMALVMALLARFWVNVAFNIGLQYAAELLPTVIRAQGVNVIHIMGYVASIVAPFIASIGRTNPALSLILLAGFAITGGVLCLFLPESLGEDLPNTLEDGEVFGRNQSFWNCPICSKPKPMDEEKLEPTPVQLRNNMRASLRGEGFRSSIISSKRTTPVDMMMNPMATETTRLRRVYTK